MTISSKGLSNLKIFSVASGNLNKKLNGFILVDARELKVAALGVNKKNEYIYFNDLLSIVPDDKVIVNSGDDILHLDGSGEMPRLDALLNSNFRLIGLPVFEKILEKEMKIGIVENFLFEDKFGYITKMEIKSSWQNLATLVFGKDSIKLKIIDRNQISEIYENRIVINGTMDKLGQRDIKEKILRYSKKALPQSSNSAVKSFFRPSARNDSIDSE